MTAHTADTAFDYPTRRITSVAATGVEKPQGAAASVFDAGRQAKAANARPRRTMAPPLDPSKVEIKSGVPMPAHRTQGSGQSTYREIVSRMNVGDHVQLPPAYARALKSCATKQGVKVSLRVLGDGIVGVWRTA